MGIATVYQDLALVSLMSVTRNFFMGREPMKGPPFFKTFDIEKANKIAAERMVQIGIDGFSLASKIHYRSGPG